MFLLTINHITAEQSGAITEHWTWHQPLVTPVHLGGLLLSEEGFQHHHLQVEYVVVTNTVHKLE